MTVATDLVKASTGKLSGWPFTGNPSTLHTNTLVTHKYNVLQTAQTHFTHRRMIRTNLLLKQDASGASATKYQMIG